MILFAFTNEIFPRKDPNNININSHLALTMGSQYAKDLACINLWPPHKSPLRWTLLLT